MRTSSVEQGINQRQPLLAEQPHQDDKLASPARLPWLPVLILAIWRATHVSAESRLDGARSESGIDILPLWTGGLLRIHVNMVSCACAREARLAGRF